MSSLTISSRIPGRFRKDLDLLVRGKGEVNVNLHPKGNIMARTKLGQA